MARLRRGLGVGRKRTSILPTGLHGSRRWFQSSGRQRGRRWGAQSGLGARNPRFSPVPVARAGWGEPYSAPSGSDPPRVDPSRFPDQEPQGGTPNDVPRPFFSRLGLRTGSPFPLFPISPPGAGPRCPQGSNPRRSRLSRASEAEPADGGHALLLQRVGVSGVLDARLRHRDPGTGGLFGGEGLCRDAHLLRGDLGLWKAGGRLHG